MTALTVIPGTVVGDVEVPPSKSQTHRALIFGAMGCGISTIHNVLQSPDTQALIEAWKLLGARFMEIGNRVVVEGLGGWIRDVETRIDVGNSGIAIRFLTALCALSDRPIVLTGDASIQRQRSMEVLLDALRQLGVRAESIQGNGYAPVVVQGPFQGGTATLSGHDSQPVSGLIIASLFSKFGARLCVENPGELPWVDLTLEWLDRLGLHYERENYTYYSVSGGQKYSGFQYEVPADWSSAAFPAAAALVTKGTVVLHRVQWHSNQGDKKLFEFFQEMGAAVTCCESSSRVEISIDGPLQSIAADMNACVDALPILAVVACYAKGETHLYNAAVAKEKECDRIDCIAKELSKMGAKIVATADGLRIRGGKLKGASLCSYGDHRMAMSLAVAALGAEGASTIDDIDCIAKTYPDFIQDLRRLGVAI